MTTTPGGSASRIDRESGQPIHVMRRRDLFVLRCRRCSPHRSSSMWFYPGKEVPNAVSVRHESGGRGGFRSRGAYCVPGGRARATRTRSCTAPRIPWVAAARPPDSPAARGGGLPVAHEFAVAQARGAPHVRRTNPIESPFAALRLRTTAAKRFKRVQNATASSGRRAPDHRRPASAARTPRDQCHTSSIGPRRYARLPLRGHRRCPHSPNRPSPTHATMSGRPAPHHFAHPIRRRPAEHDHRQTQPDDVKASRERRRSKAGMR